MSGHTSRVLPMAAQGVFIVLSLTAFASWAAAVVVPILLAWVASMALKPPVRWLRRCHIPMPVAAALVVATFVAGSGLGLVYLVRPAVEWLGKAPESLPRLREKFQTVLRPAAQLTEAASSVGDLTADEVGPRMAAVEVKDNHLASSLFSWTGNFMTVTGEVVALLFLLLASGDLFLQKIVRAAPRLREKKQAIAISREIHQTISVYLFSMGIINIVFGAVVGCALHLVGMPGAWMWGGVAALVNFVPYIGPIVGIGLVGVAGLLAYESLEVGLVPAGIYFLLHLAEANAVTPFILGRRFALNPVAIFVALIFFTWLWGPIGALLAVPILMTAKVIGDRVPQLGLVGEILSPRGSLDTAESVPKVPKFPGVPVIAEEPPGGV
ncbi:MAG: AI-2E family transporter [Limisphaerales bacterium]